MRSRMIDATIELMEQGGEAAVRIAKVAETLGVTEPLMYHHFKNRADLITAAYAEWYRRCQDLEVPVEQLMLMVKSQADYERVTKASMVWSFHPERHHARKVRLIVLGAAQTNPELAAAVNEINFTFISSLAAAIAMAQKNGWARTDIEPLSAAYWLHGQMLGRAVAEMDPGRIDLAKWDEASFDAVLPFLRPLE